MKRIVLIAHCEAAHSVDGKVGGWYNAELTKRGEQQAVEPIGKLDKLGFNIRNLDVYSSDLKRAAQTAQILTQNIGIEPILDQRLRNSNKGLAKISFLVVIIT